MKTLIKTLAFLLITLNVNCQVTSIVSLNDEYPHSTGAYVKDLDNLFDYWEGTWEGILDNKKYTFEFVVFQQKIHSFDDGDYYYEDELRGKFKVVDLISNEIIYNNLNVTEYDEYNLSGASTISSFINIIFLDTFEHCYNSAKFILIKDSTNPNQVMYKHFKLGSYGTLSGCDYDNQEDIPMYLPTQNIVLTKQ